MRSGVARVELTDARGDERRLRAAWHADRRTVVFSHWRNNVCVASTPVEVEEVASLAGLLVGALGEAAVSGADPTGPHARPSAIVTEPGDPTVVSIGRDMVNLAGRLVGSGVQRAVEEALSWPRRLGF